ncbi:hypothetical protein G9P44_001942 [Scheffersomyces stipitis]|nr:hypothetical protein G9P44_001942 [Scheffersomyces stipitis]
MQFSTVIAASTFAASAAAAFTNGTVITTEVTVTGFTTYRPISTEVVVVTCHEEKCAPATFTVTEASTLTITEPCVIPFHFHC